MAVQKVGTNIIDSGYTTTITTNPEFSGTEAARMPSGSTAQRANAQAGDIRFNTTLSLMEYYDGTNWKAIDAPPVVSSINPSSIPVSDSSFDIVITGSNFQSGAVVKAYGTNNSEITATTVVVNSSTQITATFDGSSFSTSYEDYDIKVINVSGLSGQLDNALDVNASPTWVTASGNLGTVYESKSVNVSVSATDPEGGSITYGVQGGSSLPSGLSINSSSGAITGTAPGVESDTTSTFSLTASDGSNIIPRSFNIIIRVALGTLSNPATSAKALYDAGYTTDGNYYINNKWTGNTAKQVYCQFAQAFNGGGSYHLQRFNPADLGSGATSSVGNASATLSQQSSTLTDLTTYNWRYSSVNSGAGAAVLIRTTTTAAQTGRVYLRIDSTRISAGDGSNTIGRFAMEFDDTTNTGDAATNTSGYGYSSSWQPAPTQFTHMTHGILLPANFGSSAVSRNGMIVYTANSTSSIAAARSTLASAGNTQATPLGSDVNIATGWYYAFKHQGWSDTGTPATSDHMYWVAAAI